MGYPVVPAIDFSYTGFQQGQGDNSFPGTQLDNDLLALREALASTAVFIEASFRSDGGLKEVAFPDIVSISASVVTASNAAAAATQRSAEATASATAAASSNAASGVSAAAAALSATQAAANVAVAIGNILDTDTALTGNSDAKAATQKAAKTYTDAVRTDAALKASANTFVEPQVVSKLTERYLLDLSNDLTAPGSPQIRTIRLAAGVGNGVGGWEGWGNNASGTSKAYAGLFGVIAADTAAAEYGNLVFRTIQAGTAAVRFTLGGGLYSSGQSDPGAGKINIAEVQIAGAAYPTPAAFTASFAGKLSADGSVALSANLPAGGFKITGHATPSASGDVATKGYVDSVVAANVVDHDPVRFVATTGTLATDFDNGKSAGGVTVATGDAFLYAPVGGAITAGVYIAAASGAPTRRTDLDTSGEFVPRPAVAVLAGTYAGTKWTCTNVANPTLASDSLVFTQSQAAGNTYAADGATLQLSGSTFSVLAVPQANVTGLTASLAAKIGTSALDTDVALAANDDAKVASQKAAKTYIDGRKTFFTNATAAALVTQPTTIVHVPDRDHDGDEGGGLFFRTASAGAAAIPTNYQGFTDLAGKHFAYLSRTIKLNTVDKTPHVEIKARLDELAAKGGGELIVDETHELGSQLLKDDFGDHEIVITGRHGKPTWKAASGVAVATGGHPLIALYPTTRATGKLIIQGLDIDCTAGNATAGLSLHDWKRARLYDFGGVGGTTYGNVTGDQLVSTVSVFDFEWDGGYAAYWPDLVLYPGGDLIIGAYELPFDTQTANFTVGRTVTGATSGAFGIIASQSDGGTSGILYLSSLFGTFQDNETITDGIGGSAKVNGSATAYSDGFSHVMRNVVAEYCTNVAALKREGYWLTVDKLVARYCGAGVSTAETTATFVTAGRNLEVINSTFLKTGVTGGPLRAKAGTKFTARNNIVRDWGRNPDGTGGAAIVWAACQIQGSSNWVVQNNTFEMVDWPAAGVENAGHGKNAGIRVEQFVGATHDRELPFKTQTANFTAGQTVTGITSGATGVIDSQVDNGATGVIYLSSRTGTFVDNETITDGAGGSAKADGPFPTTTWTPSGGIARGNVYRNLDYGIYELNAGVNTYLDEYVDTVVAPVFESGFNTSARASYEVAGTGAFERVGAKIWRTDFLLGSLVYNPPSIANGAGVTQTVAVVGATLGDYVDQVSFSIDLQGVQLTAWVSAADVVSVRFQNGTGVAKDLASGTIRVKVNPKV